MDFSNPQVLELPLNFKVCPTVSPGHVLKTPAGLTPGAAIGYSLCPSPSTLTEDLAKPFDKPPTPGKWLTEGFRLTITC